jgi:hypothetical protein
VKKLPIDLKLRTVTTRVSVAAWDRAQSLKKELGCSLQDVLSAALLYIELATLKRVMQSQRAALEELPASVKAILKDLDQLSAADRKALRALLEE